ncbi:hypothetical protein D3C71_2197320 [compost metagenome]
MLPTNSKHRLGIGILSVVSAAIKNEIYKLWMTALTFWLMTLTPIAKEKVAQQQTSDYAMKKARLF